METHSKTYALLVTAVLFGVLPLVFASSRDEELCITVTRSSSDKEQRGICQQASSRSIHVPAPPSDQRDDMNGLAILKGLVEVKKGAFIFVDLTFVYSPSLCLSFDGDDLKQLPFTECTRSDTSVICLSTCSNLTAESREGLNTLLAEKKSTGGNNKPKPRIGRSPDPSDRLRYNPVELLAGDSRETEESYSYEDYDDEEDWAQDLIVPSDQSESDITTIYNVEHDLNALSIGRNSNVNLDVAVEKIDSVLTLDRSVLARQRTSVKNILVSFERAVNLTFVQQDSTKTSQSPRVAVLISDTRGVRHVSGLILSSSGLLSGPLQEGCLKELTEDVTVGQLGNRTDIDGAVLLPESLRSKTRTGFTVFSQDTLFHPVLNESHTVNSRVISVTFNSDKYPDKVPDNEYVYIVFKPKIIGSKKRECAFWDFSSGGHWSNTGCELMETSKSGLDICRCNHATHFAEIITDVDLDSTERAVLDIISIVGCCLSLLGVLGIAITAVLFKQWRAELGNKFLLHLSAAIALNMSVFLAIAAGAPAHSGIACIALGALLHYSVLTCFCWMLVSAVLQFLRLVIIFSSRGSHLLLKCAAFAWGAPLTPVVVLLAIDPHLYTRDGRDFCYPIGTPFYSAVLGPIALIVLNNIIAFIVIIYNIFPCCRNCYDKSFIQNRIHDTRYNLRCLWLSILLFFLFGLTWIFGFLGRTKVFAYMFCVSATLQGFVLFIFFIVGERKVRKQWNDKTQSWMYSDSSQRKTKSTYIPGSDGRYGPRTTISSDGRVETSFDF